MTMHSSFRSVARFALVLGLALGVCVPQASAQRSQPVDRVAAVVNDEVITLVEVRERVRQALAQLQSQGIQAPPVEILESQVLERLILERAQIQHAREGGLRVDDDTLQRAIARIASNNDLDEAGLRAALEADGIRWDQFRNEIRTELLVSRLRESEIERDITVTEAEIDNFLANNPEAFSGRQVLVAHVLLRLPENVTEEEFRRQQARAEEVLRRHAQGEDFFQLAAEYSDAPDAVEGGILGWNSVDRLPGLFAEAVSMMQPGQVSDVLRSAAGLHIVKFADARGGELAGPEQLEQTRVRHILINTTEVVSDTDAESRLLALRERLVYGDDSFEDLAKVHSDDLSNARGGDLGWIDPGDTVPEFERTMNALQPGEISQPVQSPFGWHLIEVVERRVQDVTDERRRGVARNALRERKAEEAYDNWLRELRDSTYVEIRLHRDYDL